MPRFMSGHPSLARSARRALAQLSLGLAAVGLTPGRSRAQDSLPSYIRDRYVRHDHLIPMRDGIRLFTTVYSPKDTTRSYPVLLTRTPYGSDSYLNPTGPGAEFAERGYHFAFQDVRGKYRSEGEFVNVRPYLPTKKGPTEIDETTDTYDTIDWIIKQVPHNNGRVGQYGISYLGFYSTMGLIDAHPALKAVSPQAPVTDWFRGDDWHHNGAFFLADPFTFLYSFGVPRPTPTAARERSWSFPFPDSYRYFLELGPLANVERKVYRGRAPYWNEIMAHGRYDAYWKARTPLPHLKHITPAVLTVGGWYDAEDLWGTLAVYQTIGRQNPGHSNRLVMGPWFHGGWFLSDGSSLGDVPFGAKTSDENHARIELPFFEHYLRDSTVALPEEASVFETGTNRWRGFDHWPPAGVQETRFYLDPGGSLRSTPAASAGSDEFVSDPAKPVPYMDGVVTERPVEYMVADQRFASRRPDVLVYQTEPLDRDLTAAGPITVNLSVSTTGTDADWVVKVIDVYPDDAADPSPNPKGVRSGGYQQLVRADVMRGKFRQSFEKPIPFVPGQRTAVTFTLPDLLHTFRRGHRLMVQVQSSWFPLVDRNPQTFTDIYHADDRAFRQATHRVYWGGTGGTSIVVGRLP